VDTVDEGADPYMALLSYMLGRVGGDPHIVFSGRGYQAWFPFNIQICLNGREWLARQFHRQGHTDFQQDDNCFTHLGNPGLAQRLMDRQLRTRWQRLLDAVARTLNPLHGSIFKLWPHPYYWSAFQTEWATDLLFRDAPALARVYPALVRHGALHFQSPDIMRFLGRKLHGNFRGEVVSSCQRRPEGVRIKHWVAGNSIKMYDKVAQVLRVETTIGNPGAFTVLRPRQRSPRRRLAWQPLRKGVADLHRRAAISQRANERYLDALAAVEDSTPLHQLLDQVGQGCAPVGVAGGLGQWFAFANPPLTAFAAPFCKRGPPITPFEKGVAAQRRGDLSARGGEDFSRSPTS